MPNVGGFCQGSPVSPAIKFQALLDIHRVSTLTGSQDIRCCPHLSPQKCICAQAMLLSHHCVHRHPHCYKIQKYYCNPGLIPDGVTTIVACGNCAWIMPQIGVFCRGSPVYPALNSRRFSICNSCHSSQGLTTSTVKELFKPLNSTLLYTLLYKRKQSAIFLQYLRIILQHSPIVDSMAIIFTILWQAMIKKLIYSLSATSNICVTYIKAVPRRSFARYLFNI